MARTGSRSSRTTSADTTFQVDTVGIEPLNAAADGCANMHIGGIQPESFCTRHLYQLQSSG